MTAIIAGSSEVFDKSAEYEGEHFIKLPSNLRWYVYVKGYRPEMNYLYALIVDFYNVDKGVAYPSIARLAREYGRNVKTTSSHLQTLKSVGLVDFPDKGRKYYVPLKPLDQERLFRLCPEAERAYKDELAKEDAEHKRGAQNWMSRKGYR